MAILFLSRSCPLSLLILLAACGGGSGTPAERSPGQHNVSASPGTPPAPQSGSEAPATPNQPNAPTGTDTSGTGPSGTNRSQSPLTTDTFTGGVLATMLMQNTFITQPDEGRPHPLYSLYPAVAWHARTNKPITPADAPDAFGYQYLSTEVELPIQPAAFHSTSFITNFEEVPTFGRFTDIRTQLSIKPLLERDSNPASLFLFTEAAMQAARQKNATILELGKEAVVMSQVRAPVSQVGNDDLSRQTYTLSSPTTPLSLKHDTTFKFAQVLRQWRQGTAQVLQLMVIRGAESNQLRLCLNYQLPDARRLHCSLWRLPKGWQFGRPLTYEGIHVQDDRSVHPGGKGKRDWMTAPRP